MRPSKEWMEQLRRDYHDRPDADVSRLLEEIAFLTAQVQQDGAMIEDLRALAAVAHQRIEELHFEGVELRRALRATGMEFATVETLVRKS